MDQTKPEVPPPTYEDVAGAGRGMSDGDSKTASAIPLQLESTASASAVASTSKDGAAVSPSKAFIIQLRLHKPRLQNQRIHIDTSTIEGLHNTVLSLAADTSYDTLRHEIRRLIVTSNIAGSANDAANMQFPHQLRVWLLQDGDRLQDGTRLQDADVLGQSYFDVTEANWDAAKQMLFGEAKIAVRLGFVALPRDMPSDEETFRLWKLRHERAPLRVVPTPQERQKSKKEGCLQQ